MNIFEHLQKHIGDMGFGVGLAVPTPTSADPGSDEKIRILISRVERGEALFHPDDTDKFMDLMDVVLRDAERGRPLEIRVRRRSQRE